MYRLIRKRRIEGVAGVLVGTVCAVAILAAVTGRVPWLVLAAGGFAAVIALLAKVR